MKIFISQPMRGLTDDEIQYKRNSAIEWVRVTHPDEEVEVIDSFFKGVKGNPLEMLGESIKKLSEADLAVFVSGWQDARGCRIEYECVKEYGVKSIQF